MGVGAAPAGEEEGLPGATDGAVLIAAGVQVGGGLEGRLLSIQQVWEHAPCMGTHSCMFPGQEFFAHTP